MINGHEDDIKELRYLISKIPKDSDNPDDVIARRIFLGLIKKYSNKYEAKTNRRLIKRI